MKRLEPADRERTKKMSKEAVMRQMEREGWNPEHLKGVPLANLKKHWQRLGLSVKVKKRSKVLLVAKNNMLVNLMKL